MTDKKEKEDNHSWGKYQPTIVPEGTKPTIIEARQLESGATVPCPKSGKVWIGVKGDWVIKMPSGKRPDAFKKNADGEPVEMIVHGACYVVKEVIFNQSYVEAK